MVGLAHAGSSEWVRTHALPFSRASVPANEHAPPLVKEFFLVSRSCHFLSLNLQGLYFQSLWRTVMSSEGLVWRLRNWPIIFQTLYLQRVGPHHVIEEFSLAHVPRDSYRILLYIYDKGCDDCEFQSGLNFFRRRFSTSHNFFHGKSREYALLGGWVGACWFQ